MKQEFTHGAILNMVVKWVTTILCILDVLGPNTSLTFSWFSQTCQVIVKLVT